MLITQSPEEKWGGYRDCGDFIRLDGFGIHCVCLHTSPAVNLFACIGLRVGMLLSLSG